MSLFNRICALFVRNPTITVEVTGGTWSCRWKHMTAEDAMRLSRQVADAVESRVLAEMPCSATVH